MEQIESGTWIERCTHRIAQIEPELAFFEAKEVADCLLAFERTRVMGPEAAADFVAAELVRPDRGRFERRFISR